MISATEGNNNITAGDPSIFCLVCNSSLHEKFEHPEQTLVLANPPTEENGGANPNEEKERAQQEPMDTSDNGATMSSITKSLGGDAEWIRKYQSFLSKILHINFDDIADDDLEPSSKLLKTGGRVYK